MVRSVESVGLGSLRHEVETIARQLEHEIELPNGRGLLLSSFQKRLWDALHAYRHLGVSAPTSAGKSFVLVHDALQTARAGGSVLYLVPTISLIQQVTADIRRYATDHGIPNVLVLQTLPALIPKDNAIYVLTQERALGAVARPVAEFNVALAIVDEVQNLERVGREDNERAQILRDVLSALIEPSRAQRVVLSGARVRNIERLAKTLLSAEARGVSDEIPPVVNLAYAISRKKPRDKSLTLTQYADVDERYRSTRLTRPLTKPGLTGQRYTQTVLDVLGDMTSSLAANGVLVFAPTSDQATSTAVAIASQKHLAVDKRLNELADYVRDSVHRSYALATCVASGIGYHHGKVPPHLRLCVEIGMRGRFLQAVVCTTTLMQGVNLPAKTIVARNPDLFIRRSSAEPVQLSGYEFANLRGRAGRLMEDLVGRAIVLDEHAFEEAGVSVGDLPQKDVVPDVSGRFNKFRDELSAGLLNDRQVGNELQANDLLLLVRRTVLRDPVTARERLRSLGVDISSAELARTRALISQLEVPLEICKALPFWDPVVLDVLFKNRRQCPALPTQPFARDLVNTFRDALAFLDKYAPYYRHRYLDLSTDNEITGVCYSAVQWAQERSLRSIVERKDNADIDAKEVDHRVEVVIRRVVHELPRVLRPLVLMQKGENSLLSFVEYGAYHAGTRALIDLGIPREVACRLIARSGTSGIETLSRAQLIAAAKRAGFWDRAQVRAVLADASI